MGAFVMDGRHMLQLNLERHVFELYKERLAL
jgi:hypothetical protein